MSLEVMWGKFKDGGWGGLVKGVDEGVEGVF